MKCVGSSGFSRLEASPQKIASPGAFRASVALPETSLRAVAGGILQEELGTYVGQELRDASL